MTHGSVFAGIGGFDLGFERAGFKSVWQVEIEPFCQAVLRTRFARAKLFGDIRECGAQNLKTVDVVTGGFPCQDLSVAGKRAGLAGKRSRLFFEFARILDELAPRWFVIENVPGFLSSPTKHPRKDFAIALDRLTGFAPEIPEEGWQGCGVCVGPKRTVAWRLLDSQFFGVAQQRRRLFLISGPRSSSAFAVLFESEGGAGDSAEGEETAKGLTSRIGKGVDSDCTTTLVAATLSSASHDRSHAAGRRREDDFNLVAPPITARPGNSGRGMPQWNETDGIVAAPITASHGKQPDSSARNGGPPNLVATLNSGRNDGGFRTEPGQHIVIQDVRGGTRDKTDHGQGIGIREGGPSYTLSKTERHAVAFAENQRGEVVTSEVSHQLTRGGGKPGQGYPAVACSPPDADGVRDFAGLPEGLDSARYRALGNAVTVQVAEWIGRRIRNAES